jgi:hypothetical protein
LDVQAALESGVTECEEYRLVRLHELLGSVSLIYVYRVLTVIREALAITQKEKALELARANWGPSSKTRKPPLVDWDGPGERVATLSDLQELT